VLGTVTGRISQLSAVQTLRLTGQVYVLYTSSPPEVQWSGVEPRLNTTHAVDINPPRHRVTQQC